MDGSCQECLRAEGRCDATAAVRGVYYTSHTIRGSTPGLLRITSNGTVRRSVRAGLDHGGLGLGLLDSPLDMAGDGPLSRLLETSALVGGLQGPLDDPPRLKP